MMVFALIIESLTILVLLKVLRDVRRRQRDLGVALRDHTPYLVDEAGGRVGEDWRKTAAAANALITALRTAEAVRSGQLNQLEATLGSLREGVLAVDEKNGILLANNALTEIFPRAAMVLGHRVETVIQSSAFSGFLEDVRRGIAAKGVELEFSSDSGSVWVEATGAVIPAWDGSRARWVLCVLHEVTRQKRLESLRKEFVANVSHELRTPLSVIKGFVETLVDGHREIPEADRDRFLRTIQRHTDRLHLILEDLLTLSRLESRNPGLRLEPTDIVCLLRELADDYHQRAAASGHRIDLYMAAEVPPIAADPVRLRQVFENLIDNALKYTPPQSFIALRAVLVGTELEIRIADNGPGIPSKDLPHIFERFYRVDKGRSRETGGTGLGLSIVKHIVQLHGGRVWAESSPGQGTTIVACLPLQPVIAAQPDASLRS